MKDNGLVRHDNGRLKTVLSTLGYVIDKYANMVDDILEFWESDSITSEEYFCIIADLLAISHEISREIGVIDWILTNRGQDIHA